MDKKDFISYAVLILIAYGCIYGDENSIYNISSFAFWFTGAILLFGGIAMAILIKIFGNRFVWEKKNDKTCKK